MASIIQLYDNSMPCQASFFDAMFGVKKLAHFHYGNGLLVSIVHIGPLVCYRQYFKVLLHELHMITVLWRLKIRLLYYNV